MAERLKTEQMTEPSSDDTPSTSGQTSRQTLGFDDVIIKVAKAVSDDVDVRRLGLELGVQTPDINRALETNWAGGRKTSNGNVMLLQNWAETVKPSDQLPMLRAALQAIGFKEIEETCLQGKGIHGEMPDKVQRLREKLHARYIEEFSEVKVSPMDPESRTWLQHIYVSLILMLGCTKYQKKAIRYEDLFNFITEKTEKGFITRLAFLGEAGVGKSTLFAKIALDWVMGKCLQDITHHSAIGPVRNLLNTKTRLTLARSYRNLTPVAALFFTLEPIGKEVVRRSSPIRETLGVSESFEGNSSLSDVAAAAVGLFTLQNLRVLTLYNQSLDDKLYLGMSAAASQSKIQKLSMGDIPITPCRLHSILSLPSLQSLSLRNIRPVDLDDGETLTHQTTSVDELDVDGKHVTSLWNLGLHTSCPRVQNLQLDWSAEENVSSNIVTMACSPFHHLTHLHIHGDLWIVPCTLNDPVSFCKAVIASCPGLTKLSITKIHLCNEKAAEIIQLMKTHPNLTSIQLDRCCTNADLDPLISEVNSEGKLTITVKHGGRGRLGD